MEKENTITITPPLSVMEMRKLQDKLNSVAVNSKRLMKDLVLSQKAFEAVMDRTGTGLCSTMEDVFYDVTTLEHLVDLLVIMDDLREEYGDCVKIFGELPKD